MLATLDDRQSYRSLKDVAHRSRGTATGSVKSVKSVILHLLPICAHARTTLREARGEGGGAFVYNGDAETLTLLTILIVLTAPSVAKLLILRLK